MKRVLFILLVLAAVYAIVLGGCAQPTSPTTPPQSSESSPEVPQQPSPELTPTPESSSPAPETIKPVELKYDDGKPNQWAAAVPPVVCGFLIDFTPPSTPFTIKRVRILGMVIGSTLIPDFNIEILDSQKNILHSSQQPIDIFPSGLGNAEWVNVDIPDVQVDGQFFVHLRTDTGHNQGIHIGWDDSVLNEHSSVSSVSSSGVIKEASWPYPDVRMSDQSKVNWMIRVVGTCQE